MFVAQTLADRATGHDPHLVDVVPAAQVVHARKLPHVAVELLGADCQRYSRKNSAHQPSTWELGITFRIGLKRVVVTEVGRYGIWHGPTRRRIRNRIAKNAPACLYRSTTTGPRHYCGESGRVPTKPSSLRSIPVQHYGLVAEPKCRRTSGVS